MRTTTTTATTTKAAPTRWLRPVWLILWLPARLLSLLYWEVRCQMLGWHASAPHWLLVHGIESGRPLYWVYTEVCPHCGIFRPGSSCYYRWRPEHGTGDVPLPPPPSPGEPQQ